MNDRLGYACINQTLRNVKPAKDSVYCSRSMQKKTFNLQEASKRALQNCKDLLTILHWNIKNNILVFRISSDLFPRFTCSEHGYSFTDLNDHLEIQQVLKKCGDFAHSHNMCLSFHPGPYTCIGSPNKKTRLSGIAEVEYHALLVSLIDPYCRLDIPINYHIGGTYSGDFVGTAKRFIDSWKSLNNLARGCTVIENDDSKNGWNVLLLYKHIYEKTGIPITFDAHHFLFNNSGASMEADFNRARETWGERSMQVHYSQSPTADKLIPKHSDYYRDPIPHFITDCDNIHIHLESKQKDLSLLQYREDFGE
jgi:UV DNA damage endonuclease